MPAGTPQAVPLRFFPAAAPHTCLLLPFSVPAVWVMQRGGAEGVRESRRAGEKAELAFGVTMDRA